MAWGRALIILGVIALVVASQAQAGWQGEIDRVVRSEDGALWLLRDGQRHRLEPIEINAAALSLFPEGEPLGDAIPRLAHEVVVERVVTPTPGIGQAAPGWRRLGYWSGSGDKNTEPFTVRGAQFRLLITVRDPRSNTPLVSVSVRTLDGIRVDGGSFRRDEVFYVYRGPGTFYLDVGSADQWTVAVEEPL